MDLGHLSSVVSSSVGKCQCVIVIQDGYCLPTISSCTQHCTCT